MLSENLSMEHKNPFYYRISDIVLAIGGIHPRRTTMLLGTETRPTSN